MAVPYLIFNTQINSYSFLPLKTMSFKELLEYEDTVRIVSAGFSMVSACYDDF